MEALTFSTLELAPEAEAQKLSEPFAVLYADTFKRPDFPKGEITVKTADLDNAVRVFNEVYVPLGGIPLDKDHAFAEGEDAPAVGWIKQLWRDGDKLMARVAWNDLGASLIASAQYRLFSPEFTPHFKDESGTDHGFALVSGALTNRPFLRRLAPVAMSEQARDIVSEQVTAQQLQAFTPTDIPGLVAWLAPNAALTTTASNIGLTWSTTAARAERPATMPEPKTVTLSEADHAALVEAKEKVESLTAKVDAQSEQVTALSEALDATKSELNGERLKAVLDKARREGRIDAKDETTQKWTERADKLGLDTVKDLLSEFPAETIPMTERGHGHDKPQTSAAPEGVDELSHRAHALTEQLVADGKYETYAAAAPHAFKEVYG